MGLLDELWPKMKPRIVGLIREVQAQSLGAHDLAGKLHTGTIADSQAPQFLKADGSRMLIGNLGVADGVQVDGVDVSAHKNETDVHAAATAAAGHAGGVGGHTHQDAAGGGKLDHGAALSGLGDDDHVQYLNTARHDTTARHPLGTVVPHDNHTALGGLDADDHPQYLRTDGARAVGGNLLPDLTDTRDLGASDRLWRKGWVSEMDAVVFAKNAQTLIGGYLMIGKGEGTLAADVAVADTQIDFGQAMTAGDFVVFRAAGMVEYMQVGALVSGTIYGVTRNLDGSGANDWPAGGVYAVLGQDGDGRIVLNAIDTPRLQILLQGAAYNLAKEMVRLGDMNGWGDFAAEEYGFGVGDYASGNYLRYGPSKGFALRAGAGVVSIDGDGIDIQVPQDEQPTYPNTLSFLHGSDLVASLYAWYNTSTLYAGATLLAKAPAGANSASAAMKADALSNTQGGSGAGEVDISAYGRQITTEQSLSTRIHLATSIDGSPSIELQVSANDGGYSEVTLLRNELQISRNGGASPITTRIYGGLVLNGAETPAAGDAVGDITSLREKTSPPGLISNQVRLGNINGIPTFKSSKFYTTVSPVTIPMLLENDFSQRASFAIYSMAMLDNSIGAVYRDYSGMSHHFKTTWVSGYSNFVDYTNKASLIHRTKLLSTSDYIYSKDDAAIFNVSNWFSYTTAWMQEASAVHYALGTNGATTPNFRMTVETDNTVMATFYTSTGQTLSFKSSNAVTTNGNNLASFYFAWANSSSYTIVIWLNGTTTFYSGTAPTGALRTAAGAFRIYNDGSFTPTSATYSLIFATIHGGDTTWLWQSLAVAYQLIK